MGRSNTDRNAEGAEATAGAWVPFYARCAVYGCYATTLVAGFAHGLNPSGAVQLLSTLGFAWMLVLYCALDARAHRKVFVQSFWMPTMLLWPFSPLVHLVRTRGKRGALVYALHAVLVCFCFESSRTIGSLIHH